MFSRRTEHDDAPNALSAAIAEARAEGRALLDLSVANPTEVGLGLADDEVLAPLVDARALRYEPQPFGLASTRAAVAASMCVAADDVVLTASTSEAYAFAFAILCDPGDRILVPRPSYPLLEWLARLAGVELVTYDLAYDGAWYLDRASVREALARPVKAIVSVSPNNPTGSVLTESDRDFLLATGLPLVVDEVFAAYPLERDALPRPSRAERGLVLRLSGLSKLAALPQMKLGFVALEGEAGLVAEAKRRLELVADTFLSVSTPIQLAAPRWLASAKVARSAIVARCRANVATVDATFAGSTAHRLHAEAGWYAIVRLPSLVHEDAFCLELVRHGVVVQPGFYFDLPFDPAIVVSLVTPEPELRAGLAIVRETLDRAVSGA